MGRLWEATVLIVNIITSVSLSLYPVIFTTPSSLVVPLLILNFEDTVDASSSLLLNEKVDPSSLEREVSPHLTGVERDTVVYLDDEPQTSDKVTSSQRQKNVVLELRLSEDGGGNPDKLRYNNNVQNDQTTGTTDVANVILKVLGEDVEHHLSVPPAATAHRSPVVTQDASASSGRSLFTRNKDGSWGSHPLPPLDAFTRTEAEGRWVTYFYDQAMAVVQHTDDGTVLNCILQEVM